MSAMKKVELLAPAGNTEAFYGAIHAGADAVYLGGNRFGARAYAENFSEEELVACIRYAHLFGRKVYLTVNTLVKESEFSEIYEYLEPYYRAGLDGVIIQDMGVFSFIRENFPGMELHGSTQMTITGEYGAEFLKEQGACRVVPARELNLQEIRRIKEATGMQIECFIHGAMCYCYSGQCLFSSIIGGRSGNRGRCAQPCRLPYSSKGQKECYPLSLKDMCTIESIPELLRAGIDSFKIEGRMKKAEYAAGVTAIYRKYIDRYYKNPEKTLKISKEDMHALSCLYIRSERQDGYYHKHNGKEMVTLNSPAYSGSDERLLEHIRKEHLAKRKTLPVRMTARFITGEEASLTISCGDIRITLEGNPVQEASRQPISEENVIKQLSKLGDSSFSLDGSIEVELSGNAFYPLKAINELRRRGIALLEEKIILANGFCYERVELQREVQHKTGIADRAQESPQESSIGKKFSILLQTQEQWRGFCRSVFGNGNGEPTARIRLYLDADLLLQDPEAGAEMLKMASEKQIPCEIVLPKILRLRDEQYLKKLYNFARENASCFQGFLAGSMEHIGLLCQWALPGKKIIGDYSLYLWNVEGRDFWMQYLDGFCLPLELTAAEQKKIIDPAIPTEKLIYGKIPMMVTANCVTQTLDRCRKGEGGRILELTDRYHKRFPVMRNCTHCFNVIYNSVPLSLHKEADRQIVVGRLDFTTETEDETLQILNYYGGARKELPYVEYTTGHEKRGVE